MQFIYIISIYDLSVIAIPIVRQNFVITMSVFYIIKIEPKIINHY